MTRPLTSQTGKDWSCEYSEYLILNTEGNNDYMVDRENLIVSVVYLKYQVTPDRYEQFHYKGRDRITP